MLTEQQRLVALRLSDLDESFDVEVAASESGVTKSVIDAWLKEPEFHEYYAAKLKEALIIKTAEVFKMVAKKAEGGDLEAAEAFTKMIGYVGDILVAIGEQTKSGSRFSLN